MWIKIEEVYEGYRVIVQDGPDTWVSNLKMALLLALDYLRPRKFRGCDTVEKILEES